MSDKTVLITLNESDRESIYLGCGLLLAAKQIKREAKDKALELLRKLQIEEENKGL
jgi:hypothetical protein